MVNLKNTETGTTWSCERIDSTGLCSSIQYEYYCSQTTETLNPIGNINDDYRHGPFQTQGTTVTYSHECWSAPGLVALVYVLPMLCALLGVLLLFMLGSYYELYTTRKERLKQRELGHPLPLESTYESGAYTSGAPNYSFTTDILPYLLPKIWRQCCLVETIDVRLLCTLSGLSILAGIILIPLGVFTIDSRNPAGYPNFNTDNMLVVGIFFIIAGGISFCVSCGLREWCGRKPRRATKLAQIYAKPQQPLAGLERPGAADIQMVVIAPRPDEPNGGQQEIPIYGFPLIQPIPGPSIVPLPSTNPRVVISAGEGEIECPGSPAYATPIHDEQIPVELEGTPFRPSSSSDLSPSVDSSIRIPGGHDESLVNQLIQIHLQQL